MLDNAALAGRPAPAAESNAEKARKYDHLLPHLCKTCGGFGLLDRRCAEDPLGSEPCLDCTRPAAPLSEGFGSLADTRHEVNTHANILRCYIDSLSGEAFQGAIHSLGSLRDIIDGLIAVAALRPTPSNERG